jgi:hypothetical protein
VIEGQLRRLGDLFVLGDLVKPEYEPRRAELRAELIRLGDAETHGRPDVLERFRRYLLNAGVAWNDADAQQRNPLTRALFEVLLVRGGHLEAVQPRQEFQPYFVLAETETPAPEEQELTLSHQSSMRRSRGDSNPNARPIGSLCAA